MEKKYTTIHDISKITGKSITTVSRVLNDKNNEGISISETTKELILKTAKELNYFPNIAARTLSQKNSMTIGLIVPDITQSYFSELCYYISKEAELKNYNIILSHSYEDANAERKAIKMLVSRRVDGIILAPSMGKENIGYLEQIQMRHIPIVLIDRYFKDHDNFISVTTDDKQGSYELFKHIIINGAKKIAFIMGDKNTSVSIDRLEGYKLALKESNIEYNDNLVFTSSYFQEDGYKITTSIIENNNIKNIDAIVGINDPVALGIFEALEENNIRIPEDIMIAGFGNNKFTKYVKTPITSVDQHAVNISRKSCDALINLINGVKIIDNNIKTDCSLVPRLSTKFK